LFRQGITIEQIATERSITVSTVESHMSKAIASGRLQLSDYISSSDSAVIESAINEFGADCLKALFDALKEQYSFGQLRAVAAAMNLS
jgi:ATP-dependent DNA helicase RecQ